MSYILDSLTNNDEKRREQRPLAVLLPQGNRTLPDSNRFAMVTTLAFLSLLFVVGLFVYFLHEATPNLQALQSDDAIVRQLEIQTSLASDNNLNIDSVESINARSTGRPEVITLTKSQIASQEPPSNHDLTASPPTANTAISKTAEIPRVVIDSVAENTESMPTDSTVSATTPAPDNKTADATTAAQAVSTDQTITTEVDEAAEEVAEAGNQAEARVLTTQSPPSSTKITPRAESRALVETTGTTQDRSTSIRIANSPPDDFPNPKITALGYSSKAEKRFVMLDSAIYKEGDIAGDVIVVEIQRKRLVLERDGERFYYE